MRLDGIVIVDTPTQFLFSVFIISKNDFLHIKNCRAYTCRKVKERGIGLEVLIDRANRGVCDILIACVDGLTDFEEAIRSLFPQTEVQLCVIHQICNDLRYVASRDQKAFSADLKPIYRVLTREAAGSALDDLEVKWGGGMMNGEILLVIGLG